MPRLAGPRPQDPGWPGGCWWLRTLGQEPVLRGWGTWAPRLAGQAARGRTEWGEPPRNSPLAALELQLSQGGPPTAPLGLSVSCSPSGGLPRTAAQLDGAGAHGGAVSGCSGPVPAPRKQDQVHPSRLRPCPRPGTVYPGCVGGHSPESQTLPWQPHGPGGLSQGLSGWGSPGEAHSPPSGYPWPRP